MAVYDNTYSRVVAWLKIILPLLALAILSTLFLVARTIDPAKNIPYAEVDIDQLAREQRIGSPDYSGVTADGTAIRMRAQQARPDPTTPGRVIAAQIDATLDLPDGRSFDISALTLDVDTTAQIARLGGGVVVTSRQGGEMRTDALDLALKKSGVSADTETVVTTQFATMTSGQFTMTGDGSEGKPYLMVFKQGVRLIYQPHKE